MAITPPRSGVQLLNPASLIGGQQQRNNGLDQFINFALQQKLQQSSQAFQGAQRQIDRDLDMEQFIATAQANGTLVDANDPRLASLPGEADFTRINIGKGTFVSGNEVSQATNSAARAAPAESIGGRKFFEGTTQGDVMGTPSGFGIAGDIGGTGSQAASRLDDLTEAPKEDSISQLEAFRSAIEGRPELEGLVASVDQHIATVKADNEFSLTEANALNDKFGLDQIRSYVESASALGTVDRGVASKVGAREIEFRSKNDINTFDEMGNITGRRDLNLYEAHILAKRAEGIPLSDQEMQDYERIPHLLSRMDPQDRYNEVAGDIASGSVDKPTRVMLTEFVLQNYVSSDGKVDEENPLYQRIVNTMGSADPNSVSNWLSSPASFDYRASWALSNRVGPTVSSITREIRNGSTFPMALGKAINVEGSFIHQDIPWVEPGPRMQTRGGAVSESDDAELEQAARDFVQNSPAPLLNALDAAINSGDFNTMQEAIKQQAEIALAAGSNTALSENARETANRWSQSLDQMAAMDSVSLAQMSRYISIYGSRPAGR